MKDFEARRIQDTDLSLERFKHDSLKEQGRIMRAWVVASFFVSIPIIVYGLGELLRGK